MRVEVVAMERRTMMADDSSVRSMCDERDERRNNKGKGEAVTVGNKIKIKLFSMLSRKLNI